MNKAAATLVSTALALTLLFLGAAFGQRAEDGAGKPTRPKAAPAAKKSVPRTANAANVQAEQKAEAPAAERAVEIQVVGARGMLIPRGAPAADIRAAIEQQLMQQLRPVWTTELRFLRSVCPLTANQRKALAIESEQILNDAVKMYTDAQQKNIQRGFQPTLNARKQIQERLEKAVAVHAGREQATAYLIELESREREQKDVGVRLLVAELDRTLLLSADQRAKLTESLRNHWDASWSRSIEMLQQNEQLLPAVPNQYVTPYLGVEQKQMWNSLPKNSVTANFDIGFADVGWPAPDERNPLLENEPTSSGTEQLPDDVFQSAPRQIARPARPEAARRVNARAAVIPRP